MSLAASRPPGMAPSAPAFQSGFPIAVRMLLNRELLSQSRYSDCVFVGVANRDHLDIRDGQQVQQLPQALRAHADVSQRDLVARGEVPCPPKTCRGTTVNAAAAAVPRNLRRFCSSSSAFLFTGAEEIIPDSRIRSKPVTLRPQNGARHRNPSNRA